MQRATLLLVEEAPNLHREVKARLLCYGLVQE
jgi:hypothetical protein